MVDELASKQIGIRVTPTLNKRLEAVARREGNRVTAVARRLLMAGLEREEADRTGAAPPTPSRAA